MGGGPVGGGTFGQRDLWVRQHREWGQGATIMECVRAYSASCLGPAVARCKEVDGGSSRLQHKNALNSDETFWQAHAETPYVFIGEYLVHAPIFPNGVVE